MSSTKFILSTKLYRPPTQARFVPRPRLLALLAEGLSRPLTLISAPAGFGKTTLLSEWCASRPGAAFPLAWLSLDADDNEPFRFMTYLAAALGSVKAGIGDAALVALRSQQPPPPDAILMNLVHDLDNLSEPFALVMDDYHVISSQVVHAALQFLLEHLPLQMHLVLLTRADPPLPLARLRARNQLTEIRAPALRFLPEEAAQFLNQAMQLGLTAADVIALETRTEGWIAGLQLAALSLRAQADKHAFVTAFTGDDRYIMDYLLEEVLQRQSPEVQDFLLKTSILDRLCEPLCAAVTGASGSRPMLISLEQANLFVVPLDNRRTWYRYHSLFADLLRRRLHQASTPSDWEALYRRACAWYEREGLIVEAVSQALSALDFELAAGLLERHVLTVFFRGETMLVHNWLKALPQAAIRTRPLLSAMYANTIAHAGAFQSDALSQARAWLEEAELGLAQPERTEPGSTNPSHAALTRSFLAMSRAYLALWSGEPPQTVIALARQALAGLPPAEKGPFELNFQRLRSGLNNNLAISYTKLGDEDSASQAYAEAERIGESCGDLLNMYTAIANQGSLLRRHARLPEAAALYKKRLDAKGIDGALQENSLPYIGVIYLALGQILLEWNDLASAEAALANSLELSRLMAAGDGQLESSLSLARLMQARGEFHAAQACLDQIDRASDKAGILVPAYRVRLQLAYSQENLGSLKNAFEWAEGRVLSDLTPFWPAVEPLTLIRVLIAQRRSAAQSSSTATPDLGSLMRFLEHQLAVAEKSAWVEQTIELRMLQALAWQVQNHLPKALVSLQNALELAEPGGYMRLFLDEGLPMRRLLTKIRAGSDRINEYAGRLLAAGATLGATPALVPHPQALVEPLSARELEVLRLLVQGSSNAEIAQELVITLNTTKKHVTHIFEKLGVTKRSDAARRARELELVTPSSR